MVVQCTFRRSDSVLVLFAEEVEENLLTIKPQRLYNSGRLRFG